MATASGTRISPGLARLIRALDAHGGRVPLAELTRVVRDADLSLADVAAFVRFGADGYQDTLIYTCGDFELHCLCWKGGQRSSVHDHRGSSCVVRVLHGTLTNTDFARDAAGAVRDVGTRDLGCGQVDARQDEEIHQLANLRADGADAVSLHVYAPPLGETNVFDVRPKPSAGRRGEGGTNGAAKS